MRRLAMLGAAAAALGGGCASFEDPQVVLDLRVVAMTATEDDKLDQPQPEGPGPGPEFLIDLPPDRTFDLVDIRAQLERMTTYVHALVADPGSPRPLRWSATLCVPGDGGRCDPEARAFPLDAGVIGDPESTPDELSARTAGVVTIRVPTDDRLIAVLLDALERDLTRGLGGLDYLVSLQVGRSGDDPANDVFAGKRLRVSPRIPASRRSNQNPSFTEFTIVADGEIMSSMRGHCATPVFSGARISVRSGQRVTMYPQEAEGAREQYDAVTLDGKFQAVTESVSYQWLGTAGQFAEEFTGGPPDIFGNVTLNGTEWTAPNVTARRDVSIWMIQRDDRLGVTPYETCIEVRP